MNVYSSKIVMNFSIALCGSIELQLLVHDKCD